MTSCMQKSLLLFYQHYHKSAKLLSYGVISDKDTVMASADQKRNIFKQWSVDLINTIKLIIT